MYRFQISLHPRSSDVTIEGELARKGQSYPTLRVPSAALATTFACSFEQAAAALAELPRMFIEPDGSFVWVSASADQPWQVDGVLYDRDGRLLFVEMKGTCPSEQFDRILAACGWPATSVMLQLTRRAVFVDEPTFRKLASAQ